jgi:hypothetical protein
MLEPVLPRSTAGRKYWRIAVFPSKRLIGSLVLVAQKAEIRRIVV